MRKYFDKLFPDLIPNYQKLSEKFIEEFSDFLSWSAISEYQELPESFIDNHTDKVKWACIFRYQRLSRNFLIKHIDKINMYWNALDLLDIYSYGLGANKKISLEIKKEIVLLKKMIN